MLYLPFALLILAALLCWGLSRFVQTRWLGGLATLALLGALLLLLGVAQTGPLPLESSRYPWAQASGFSVMAGLQLDGLTLLLGLVLLGSASLCLWSLVRALPPGVTGYGNLFAALLLLVQGSLLALLSVDLLLLVFGWGVVLLSGLLARRAAGALDEQRGALTLSLPSGLLLFAAVLLFGLGRQGNFATDSLQSAPLSGVVFGAWVAAVAAAMGLPLFGRSLSNEAGPLQLSGLLLAAGLPLLGSYSMLRLYALTALSANPWPPLYHHVLLGLGAGAAICCAVAALQSRQLGSILGCQMSAQLGLMLLALGLPEAQATVAALALLLNAVLTTAVAGLALGTLVRRTGSDDLRRQPRLARPLRAAGSAYALAAASALGLPPMWGFWARSWLLDAPGNQDWLLLVLLLSSSLLGLSYLGPLTLFWRTQPAGAFQEESAPASPWLRSRVALPASIGAAGLLALSLLPTQVWQLLLQAAAGEILSPDAVRQLRLFLPGVGAQLALLALLVLLVLLALLRLRRLAAQPQAVPFTGGEPLDDDPGTPLVPDALGHSLRGLALLAGPTLLHGALGRALQSLSGAVNWAFQIFGGRFYLTGVFVAMIVLLILIIA